MQKLIKTQLRIREYLLLAVVFLVPLILGYHKSPLTGMESAFLSRTHFIDLYNFWKVVVLVVLMALILLPMAMDWVLGSTKTLKTRFIVCCGGLMLAIVVSTIFSMDREVALRGLVDRYEGLYAWLAYIVIVVAMYEATQIQGFWRLFSIAVLISATVVASIGMLQYYGIDVLNHDFVRYMIAPDDVASGKKEFFVTSRMAVSTLSNPNYLGGYMGAVSLLAIWKACLSRKQYHVVFHALISAILIACLIASQSDAGMLAFTVVAPLLFYLIYQNVGLKNLLTIVGSIAVAATLLIIIDRQGLVLSQAFLWECIYIVLSTSTLIYKGKVILPWLSQKRVMVSIGVAGLIIVLLAGIYYGAKQVERPSYLKAIEINGSEIEFSYTAGVLMLIYQDGEVSLQGEGDSVVPFESNLGADGITEYKVTEPPFEFLSFQTANEGDYKVLKTSDGILFFLTEEGAYWIGNNRSPSEIENTVFPIAGIEAAGSGRGYIWSRSLLIAPKHMITGVGPDNFVFAFPQNDPAGKAMMGGATVYIDKPHNLYLKVLVENGVVGLAFLVLLIAIAIENGLRNAFTGANRGSLTVSALVLLSFSISSVFNDSLPSITPVMMAFLGCSIGRQSFLE